MKRLETRYDFQQREVQWREGMNRFLIDDSFTHDDVDSWRNELLAFADEAFEISRWKLSQMIRVSLYDPTLYLMYQAWRDTSAGLTLLALELWEGETTDTWRVCDNATIFWLLGLLMTYNDAACLNISDCVQRWSDNTRMWVARNFEKTYANLVVHDPRCQNALEIESLLAQNKDLKKELSALRSVQAITRVSFKDVGATNERSSRTRTTSQGATKFRSTSEKDKYVKWKELREQIKQEEAKSRESSLLKRQFQNLQQATSSTIQQPTAAKQPRHSEPTPQRRDRLDTYGNDDDAYYDTPEAMQEEH
jgi:hypothetical protein